MRPYIIFPALYNRKPYFFRIGLPDKSVFFSYCTLCKGSNSLIFVVILTKNLIDPKLYMQREPH